MPLTANDLAEKFVDILNEAEYERRVAYNGEEPRFPMLVMTLENESSHLGMDIANRLEQLWPRSRGEITHVSVCPDDDGWSTCRMVRVKPHKVSGPAGPIAVEELPNMVMDLLSPDLHFAMRNKLCVYYLMSTHDCLDISDFEKLLEVRKWLRDCMALPENQMAELCLISLDEHPLKADLANSIKACVSRYVQQGNDNVVVVGNRRSDGAFLRDPSVLDRVMESIIALSNCRDLAVSNQLFSHSVLTAGYATVNKPNREIALAVVLHLLSYLDKKMGVTEDGRKLRPLSSEMLGLTAEGTIGVLDKYVNDQAASYLLTRDQLELLPRKGPEDSFALSELTPDELDELTLGAWNSFMNASLKALLLALKSDESWQRDYADYLAGNLSVLELAALDGRKDEVANTINRAIAAPSVVPKGTVHDATRELRMSLLRDEDVCKIVEEIIRVEARHAKEVIEAWKGLVDSLQHLGQLRDQSIKDYYEHIIQDFFDKRGVETVNTMLSLRNEEALAKGFDALLRDIVMECPVFQEPFDVELQNRLDGTSGGRNAQQYIREMVTGDNVYTYYNCAFDLGAPILKAEMLDDTSQLYDYLSHNLDNSTYFYDSDSLTEVSTIYVYQVPDYALG